MLLMFRYLFATTYVNLCRTILEHNIVTLRIYHLHINISTDI